MIFSLILLPNSSAMKKILPLLLFLSTCSFSLFSQQNFQPGYIILQNGDSLSSEIDNEYWRKNPIDVNTRLKNELRTYQLDEVKAFKVGDYYFKSTEVNIEVSPIEFEKLGIEKEPLFESRKVFLQVLYDGKKQLYYCKSDSDREYFYIKQDGRIELLIFKKFLIVKDDRKFVAANRLFVEQLRNYLNDCTAVESQIDDMKEMNLSNMNKLFRSYYAKCAKKSYIYNSKMKNTEIKFGIVSGVSISNIQFKGDLLERITNSEFTTSTNPTVGLFLDLKFRGNREKWSIYNELLYNSLSSNASFRDEINDMFYFDYDFTVKANYLTLNNLLRYNIVAKDKLKWFLEAGISNGYAVSLEVSEVETEFFRGEETIEFTNPFLSTRNYEQGFIFGTGMSISKISLNFRYEKAAGISRASSTSSPVTSFFFLLGYTF